MVTLKSLGKQKNETQCKCYDNSSNHILEMEYPESFFSAIIRNWLNQEADLITICFTKVTSVRNHKCLSRHTAVFCHY